MIEGGKKVNIIGFPSFIDKFRRAFKFIVSLHYTPRPLISSPIQTACRLLSIIKSSLLLWYVKCHSEQKYENNLKKHIRKMLIVLKLIMKQYILFFFSPFKLKFNYNGRNVIFKTRILYSNFIEWVGKYFF